MTTTVTPSSVRGVEASATSSMTTPAAAHRSTTSRCHGSPNQSSSDCAIVGPTPSTPESRATATARCAACGSGAGSSATSAAGPSSAPARSRASCCPAPAPSPVPAAAGASGSSGHHVASTTSRSARIDPNSCASARAAVGPTLRMLSATSTRHSSLDLASSSWSSSVRAASDGSHSRSTRPSASAAARCALVCLSVRRKGVRRRTVPSSSSLGSPVSASRTTTSTCASAARLASRTRATSSGVGSSP